jgi:hypothetical protein
MVNLPSAPCALSLAPCPLRLVGLILIAETTALFSALAQGMAAGDQIGIPALDGSVHRLQRNSHFAVATALILDLFAGILVAPWMLGEESARSNLPFVFDALLGTAIASVATVVFCLVIFEIAGHR